MTASFPTTPDALGAAELTEYLRSAGALDTQSVVMAEHQLIGTGKMGDSARFELTYDADAPNAPSSVVAKFPSLDESTREMAGAAGAYRNEAMFYRVYADRTPMRTPLVYAIELSDDGTDTLLVMEDLAPAEPGSQLVGESREHASLAIGEAAKLAAAFSGDTSLAAADHVPGSDGAEFGQALMVDAWPKFLERFGDGISSECIAFGDHYMPRHAKFATHYDGARTLAHGDFRSENILFAPDGTMATVDWQTTSETSPLADAAYFLGGSLIIEDRREWERELVEEYRDALGSNGVSLDANTCWDLYREQAMHGLLLTILGATFSSPDERGDQMFLVMIQRHLQACVDLDAQEFLA